jgi:uncharacterized membrane protein
MPIRDKLNTALRRYFLSGILVIVPLIITFMVLRFLFEGVDGLLSPIIAKLIKHHIPGLGLVATIILIFIAGILTANVVGSRLFKVWEIFFVKTPLIRTIYGSSKKLVEAVTTTDKHSFKYVVLVEFPRRGIYSLGFLTNELKTKLENQEEELIVVFIPSTPTPFTGWTLLFRREEVIHLDIKVEEGIKFFVSGGIASPDMLAQKDTKTIEPSN